MRVTLIKGSSDLDLERKVNYVLCWFETSDSYMIDGEIATAVKDIKYSCVSFESGFVDYTAMIIFETKKNDNK